MIFILLVLGIFLLDYKVKEYTDSHRLQGASEEILGGKIILRNCHNDSGAFGIFKNHKELGNHISLGVLIIVGWEFAKLLFQKGTGAAKLGLSMALGGGLSNYYDRSKKGYVTDYFSFGSKREKLKKIVFNISDFFIFAGCIIYAISQLFTKTKK